MRPFGAGRKAHQVTLVRLGRGWHHDSRDSSGGIVAGMQAIH